MNLIQLKELLAALDSARRDSTAGVGYYCPEPLVGEDGNDYRWEPKPRALRPTGHKYPTGEVLEEMPGGGLGIKVKLGVHGRAYLAVDPETGVICCQRCAESDAEGGKS